MRNLVPLVELLPDWNRYGKGAGHVRNKLIAERADLVLLAWDGTSKGTLGTWRAAWKLQTPCEWLAENPTYQAWQQGLGLAA